MENRKLNFEVLRILSMVMITSFHYCIHGNSEMIFSSKFSINQVLSYIIGSWGIVGVTCFFMISSWFLIEQKRFSAKKWIQLYGKITIFEIICMLCSKMLGEKITILGIINIIFTPINNTYWYVTSYMLFIVLIPYLNKIVRNISEKNLRFLTYMTLFVNFVLTPLYKYLGGNTPTFTLLFAISLFLLTTCIKLEIINVKVNRKIVIGSFVGVGMLLCSLSIVGDVTHVVTIKKHIYDLVDIFSPIPIILGIILFTYFKDKNIIVNNYIKKVILNISKCTFGVYLFHENPLFRYLIWDKIFRVDKYYDLSCYKYLCNMVLTVGILFILGIILDKVIGNLVKSICNKKRFDEFYRRLDMQVNIENKGDK